MLAQHSVKISKKGSREILFHRFGNLGRDWDLFWRCTVRITFTGETCLWPSWHWLSFLWPSWLWLSWFWVKSLSFSSLGGGDAPPFSPPPPPWHHFLGSNVDLRQKKCSSQVLVKLRWIVKRRVHLCTGPIHSWTRLLNSSAWEEIWVLEIFAADWKIVMMTIIFATFLSRPWKSSTKKRFPLFKRISIPLSLS